MLSRIFSGRRLGPVTMKTGRATPRGRSRDDPGFERGRRTMSMTLGDYVILAQRGGGADGVSYRARERGEGRLVEVRVLDAARRAEARWPILAKRVRASALIDHPSA